MIKLTEVFRIVVCLMKWWHLRKETDFSSIRNLDKVINYKLENCKT